MLVKQMVDNGNDAVRINDSLVPPEAEAIGGTKQRFAPARSPSRQPVSLRASSCRQCAQARYYAPARFYHLATLFTYARNPAPPQDKVTVAILSPFCSFSGFIIVLFFVLCQKQKKK
jgi:hypothetical protein